MVEIKREELIRKIKIGLFIFVLITLSIFVFTFIFTYEEETKDFFKYFKKLYLLYTFLFWLFFIIFDTLTIYFISFKIKRIGFLDCFTLITTGQFLATTTPFGIFGLPFQIYYLNKKNYEIGEGLSIFGIKSAIYIILYIFLIPIVLIYTGSIFENIYFKHAFKVISFIILIGIFLIILFAIKPEKLSKIIKWKRLNDEIIRFRNTIFSYFSSSPFYFFLSFIFASLSYLSYIFIPVFLLKGLQLDFSVQRVMLYQIALRFGILFSPSPGGSGFAEAGFLALFFKVIPVHFLGIYTLLWRFFTAYLGPIVGGIFLINFLRKEKI